MSEDIVGQIKDIKGRTWQEAFYIQTKAFLEKNSEHLKEIERLKAEVEELKLENSQYEEHHKYGQNVIISLREQVERLTKASFVTAVPSDVYERVVKAGDAMAEEIALAKRQDEGSRFDPIEMHYDHELIVKWLAAKEGKPTK
jgi:predicted nuclease with TOPRIM domain